ncbi:MAG: LarC family nickel insertion protein [Erysipelotrichia bacterium]|nr:LarC family nickel insertion protein [Erysipelotrichia bacterium]
MTILYWDCFSGIAGNMAVASLLDLGASRDKLVSGLESIPFEEGKIGLLVEERVVDGIRGIYFNTVDDEHAHSHSCSGPLAHTHCHEHDGLDHDPHDFHEHHEHLAHSHEETHAGHSVDHEPSHDAASHAHAHAPHRGLKEICKLVEQANISLTARNIALSCFKVLAEAEALVHKKSVDEVHFHEVGARDSIADIVGVAICLDDLRVNEVKVSPVHLGSGTVACAHGIMPVPAPATALLLKGYQVIFDHLISFELTTPTGAAILKGVGAQSVSGLQSYTRVGHGHGSRKIGQANFLRAFLSDSEPVKKNSDSVVLLTTNIDNATGEELGHALSELMKNGAYDACLIPLLMKKGRPGNQLQVMAAIEDAETLEKKIFDLLPTLGVRRNAVERSLLPRETVKVKTPAGELAGKKITESDGSIVERVEFDETVRLAEEQNSTPRKIKQKIVV